MFKTILLSIIGLIALVALAFGLELFGLQWKSYFGPKRANIEREIFTETRSFNEGKLQELTKFRYEYLRTESEHEKKAIESMVRHQFADYDRSKLPYELEQFVETCMTRQ